MDFGRQPKPITITFTGETIDVIQYMQKIKRYIEGGGDNVDRGKLDETHFYLKVYPRAVND